MKRNAWIFAAIAIAIGVVIFALVYSPSQSTMKRPQDPIQPYPYISEDITFNNDQAQVTLAGTLTLPSGKGTYPAVILISGSGPQNRNSEMAGHRPFLILADHLTRKGIAVLRYDDRGFGESTGNFAEGTSLDFSYDVESAVNYLKTRKEIKGDQIGLIGHSDGGMIAPMVAARSGDVNFIVLLAGPGVNGQQLLLNRQQLMERKLGMSESEISKSRAHAQRMIEIISRGKDDETLKKELNVFLKDNIDGIPDYVVPKGMTKDEFILRQIGMLSGSWFKFFLSYDPVATLKTVKCPVLALNGDKDVQVPSSENLKGIESALHEGGNTNVTTRELRGMNHLFQECVTGMTDEYGTIEQTFSPIALNEISKWLLELDLN